MEEVDLTSRGEWGSHRDEGLVISKLACGNRSLHNLYKYYKNLVSETESVESCSNQLWVGMSMEGMQVEEMQVEGMQVEGMQVEEMPVENPVSDMAHVKRVLHTSVMEILHTPPQNSASLQPTEVDTVEVRKVKEVHKAKVGKVMVDKVKVVKNDMAG
jgi:hypothetical protein